MLDPDEFIIELKKMGFTFFCGVPCSFLKGLINSSINHCEYVTATNEGDAVALCAGAQLGGKKSVILMQNSGLTNAISPLTSLNYTFKIPLMGFVSLRGEKGLKDEPQHELMGIITTTLLDLMQIRWDYLSPDFQEAKKQLEIAFQIIEQKKSFFFVVRKNTFDDKIIRIKEHIKTVNQRKLIKSKEDNLPTRGEVLKSIHSLKDNKTAFIATTGFTGRELFEIEDFKNNFYMIGSMGCAGSIGLGLSLVKPEINVIVIDGDGALLMRLGSMATIGHHSANNFLHILLDNNSYESTGSQRTVSNSVDFIEIALACGYTHSIYVHDLDQLTFYISEWKKNKGLTFIYIKIKEGTNDKLGRPIISPVVIKERFMEALDD